MLNTFIKSQVSIRSMCYNLLECNEETTYDEWKWSWHIREYSLHCVDIQTGRIN